MKASYADLSRMTGISYKTLKKALDAAGIEPIEAGGQGKAHLFDCAGALEAIYNPTDDRAALDLNTERARLAKEQADEKAMKNAILRGELMPIDEIRDQWARIAIGIRINFLALPSRLAQMLETVSTPTERRAMIDNEIKTILTALADHGENAADHLPK